MLRQRIKKSTRIVLALSSAVVLLACYFGLAYRQHKINPLDTTIPTVSQFAHGLEKMATPDRNGKRMIIADLKATYTRYFVGLAVGIGLSVFVGMLMGCWTPAEAFFGYPIAFLGFLPPTAMLAIYFVLFGTQFQLYISMIAFGIFPGLTLAIYRAARNDVSDRLIDKAYTLGASHFEVIYEVIFKQILPRIIEMIRGVTGPAMVFLIAGEWLTADIGFGHTLKMEARLTHMNIVYIYLIILGVAGWLIDQGLLQFRRKFCAWFGD